VLRAALYEHANMGGHAIYIYGGGNCTTSTTNQDFGASSMPGRLYNSWNDQVSSFRDYAACDVKLYENKDYGGASTGWMNGGTNGKNVPAGWNDRASSVRLS
jgi:hypothetical protein